LSLPAPRVDLLTTARADYSLILPLARALAERDDVAARLVFTGSHCSANERDGLPELRRTAPLPTALVACQGIGESHAASGLAMAEMTAGFARLWADGGRPDLCVLLGDRFELLPPASLAVLLGMPICHLYGGEEDVSYCFDTQVRNAVTKMAHLHLVMHEAQRERLLRMGEEDWRIHVCGNTAIADIAVAAGEADAAFAAHARATGLPDGPLLAACYLPPTAVPGFWRQELPMLFEALAAWPDHHVVWAGVNADPESRPIQAAIEAECARRGNHRFEANLGRARYFGLLRRARALVGNSSSGLLEAASFGLPVVNVGIRQTGRLCGDNVLSVPAEPAALGAALATALADPAFRAAARAAGNPFVRADAAGRMAELIVRAAGAAPTGLLLKRTAEGNPARVGGLQRVPEYPPIATMHAAAALADRPAGGQGA